MGGQQERRQEQWWVGRWCIVIRDEEGLLEHLQFAGEGGSQAERKVSYCRPADTSTRPLKLTCSEPPACPGSTVPTHPCQGQRRRLEHRLLLATGVAGHHPQVAALPIFGLDGRLLAPSGLCQGLQGGRGSRQQAGEEAQMVVWVGGWWRVGGSGGAVRWFGSGGRRPARNPAARQPCNPASQPASQPASPP